MKLHKFLLFLIIFCIFGCDKTEENILVIGTSADYPPFEFFKNGELAGFDIDIANEIAKELNMKAKIVDMDFAGLIPSLNNEQIDMIISSLSITEERKNNVDFSDVYYQGFYGVLTKDPLAITQESEFEGKKIGVQLGSTWESFINSKKDKFSNIEVVALSRLGNLIEELKIGRVDMVIVDEEQAYNFATNNKDLNYHVFDEMDEGLAIAFKKNSPQKDKVNQALQKLKHNKILDQLKAKWFKAA
ncbi:MAG: substrate-binding periplasmic protein [Alphaproteobacteria bacterium]